MSKGQGLLILSLAAALAAAGYFTLRGFGLLDDPLLARVKEVPPGHQEIAWVTPATSADSWERLVAALHQIEADWPSIYPGAPALRVSFDKAFLPLTADVPEISLHLDGHQARLWLRWYKLSGEVDSSAWIGNLVRRPTPPLAIIGGDTSDRALTLARALEENRSRWQGCPPLFLITTATADRYYPGDNQNVDLTQESWPKLMEVYPARSFRFSFTNSHMAQAVMEFVKTHLQVWTDWPWSPQTMAGGAGQGQLWSLLGALELGRQVQPIFLYTIAWADDRYSLDLADRFARVFVEQFNKGFDPLQYFKNDFILYSAGDFLQPNPREELAVGLFLADEPRTRQQPQLLVLPTGAQRARRFLRTLCRRAPLETRQLVVVSGDSISFNSIYRDRDLAWNVQDVPVPLVFFSHRDPVDAAAGFGRPTPGTGRIDSTGTQDVLLFRDVLETVLQAAWEEKQLLTDHAVFPARLRRTYWHKGRPQNLSVHPAAARGRELFDADGNRLAGTGEHVVWLKPLVENGRVLPRADITIWRLRSSRRATSWEMSRAPLTVNYDRAAGEVHSVHAVE